MLANTFIKTKNEDKQINTLKVGDKVISSNGNEYKIVKITENHSECYKILFTDGTYVICDTKTSFKVKNNKNHLFRWTKLSDVIENFDLSKYECKFAGLQKSEHVVDDIIYEGERITYGLVVEQIGNFILHNSVIVK